jgi:hypothetical protein
MKKSNKKCVRFRFFLVVCCFCLTVFSINAVELRFKDGDIYHATLLAETEKTIKVSFQNEIYEISKTDLEFFDVSKNGKDESYKVTKVSLRDGSVIKGIFVEENSDDVILKTELGFLNLKKSSIKQPYPKKEDSPAFPRKYLFEEVQKPETRIGLSVPILFFVPPLSQNTTGIVGSGLFIEPAFVQWRNWVVGFRMEMLNSLPNNSLKIAQSSIYAIRPIWDSESKMHHLFYGFSLGIANLQFKVPTGSGDTRTGINPVTSFDLGYEYSGWQSWFFRSSIRSTFYMEPKELIPAIGLEFTAGFKL